MTQNADSVAALQAELDQEETVLLVYATVMSRHGGCPRSVRAAKRVAEIRALLAQIDSSGTSS